MVFVRAETSDVAFRLLMAIGELWDGLHGAGVDPGRKGLHLTREYLGGYTRYASGPGSRSRLIFEWNESSRHLRILRDEEWPNFESTISVTVAYVREQARTHGLSEVVDARLVKACQDPAIPMRRTVAVTETAAALAVSARRTVST